MVAIRARWGDRLRIPLRTNILLVFLAILLPLCIGVIGYNYFASRKLAITAITQQVLLISDRIAERQERYMRPATSLTKVYAKRYSATAQSAIGDGGFAPGVLEVMQLFPQIYAAYAGYENGDFTQVVHFSKEELDHAEANKIPAKARFAVRKVTLSRGGPSDTWHFLDEGLRPVGDQHRVVSYDPRNRPWYISARQSSGIVETGPYEFSASKQQGITFSQRISGPKPGAFGVDMTISDLTSFMSSLRVGTGGHIVILGQTGKLIASTAGLQQPGARPESPNSGLSMEELLNLLTHSFDSADREHTRAEIRGVDYLVDMRVLRLSDDVWYRVIVLAPLAELLTPISRISLFTVIISVVIGLLAIPLILILSTRIAKPILQLAEDARNIQQMKLKPLPGLHTSVAEVHDLANAFTAMKRTLNHVTKFVPGPLVRDLLEAETDPVPGGVKRNISILFTDVQDFTNMSQGMAPGDLLRKATTYYGEVGSVLLESGGLIGRFMGDGIVAFWNAPAEDPEHAVHAAQAVLQSRSNSEALNRRWESYGWPIMRTRFGLHIGDAIVGNIGLPDRMEYNAFGDCLNIASRLEGLNKYYGTQILVSGAMAEKLSGGFTLRWVDRVAPKGTTLGIEIHELVGSNGHGANGTGGNGSTGDGDGFIQTSPLLVEMAAYWNDRVIVPYQHREWEAALKGVDEVLRALPGDPLAKLYLARCKQYRDSPPPNDWDGVVRHTEK